MMNMVNTKKSSWYMISLVLSLVGVMVLWLGNSLVFAEDCPKISIDPVTKKVSVTMCKEWEEVEKVKKVEDVEEVKPPRPADTPQEGNKREKKYYFFIIKRKKKYENSRK